MNTPSTVTIPAHLLQSGDRLNLHGYWHTAGRVTLENYDTGSEVHVVLDAGDSDARIDAHEGVQIALAEEPPTARSEADAAGWGEPLPTGAYGERDGGQG